MEKNLIRKSETQQHFSLRKLTVGVASVLVGTTFMVFGGQAVHADSIGNTAKAESEEVTKVAGQQTGIEDSHQNDDLQGQNENASRDIALDSKESADIADSNAPSTNSGTSESLREEEVDSNVAVKNNNVSSNQNNAITNKDVLTLLGLEGKELSDEQLAKLGITRDTYLKDGIKYRAAGGLTITDENKNIYHVDNVFPIHHKDGSMYSNKELTSNINWGYALDHDVANVYADYKYAPIAKGGVIYVNKGQNLTTQDAYRGLPTNIDKAYQNVEWSKNIKDQVNTNKAGDYSAIIDVTYKSELGQSVGVKVTVVDLQGQPIITHIDADTPDPTKGITGEPAGTTDIHWAQVPSTKTPGSTQGVVEVTYPDGTKGTTVVPVTVIAPTVPGIIYVPKSDKVPNPSTVVTNSNDIKDKIPDTTYTWETTPDIDKGGHIPAVVVTHWPDGKTTDSKTTIVVTEEINENHEVVRTIVENIPNQDPKTIKQSVTFSRTNTGDSANHSQIIKAGTWKADGPAAWGVFTPDQVKGYTADPAQVPAMAVSPDTPNAKVVINYKANNPGTPDTPVTPPVDPGDNPTPVTPPVKPEQKPSTPTPDNNDDTPAPTPHATKTPAKDNGGKKTSAKGRGEQTKNSGLGNGENANNGRVTVRPLATAKPASLTMKKTVNSEQKATLPQTGKKDNVALTAIGVAIAAAGSLLGLADSKKRRS